VKLPFAIMLKHSYSDADPRPCRDCRGSWGVKLLARAVYQLHRLHQKLRRAVGPHPRLLWPLSRCIALGSQQLSKRLLLACEVAMELMLSLTYAHQVQWLQRHRPSHQLLTEVHEQSQKVHHTHTSHGAVGLSVVQFSAEQFVGSPQLHAPMCTVYF